MEPERTLFTGPAGCGKTTLAFERASREVQSGELAEHQRVLLLSFSRAAVFRMWQTSRQTVPRERRGLLHIDTFHGFAWGLIQRFGRYLGHGQRPFVVSKYERELGIARPGSLSFDELERECLRLLAGSNAILAALRSTYPVMFVDEFQDTSSAQWDLIQRVSGSGRLYLFGDVRQAIYRSREEAEQRMEQAQAFGCHLCELGGSSRRDQSNGAITRLAQAVQEGRFQRTALHGLVASGALSLADRYDKPGKLGWTVKQQIASTRRDHRDWTIGVITLTRFRTETVAASLDKDTPPFRRLPHDILGLNEQFLTADELVCAIWQRLSADVLTDEDILRLAGIALMAWRSADDPAGLAREMLSVASGSKPNTGVSRFLTELGRERKGRGVRRLASTTEVLASLTPGAKTFSLFARRRAAKLLDRLERTIAGDEALPLTHAIERMRRASVAESVRDKHTGSRAVQVMPLRSCKRREYDVVVLANGPHDQFPHPADASPYPQARQQLYTAITRAKHRVIVVAPKSGASPLIERFYA